MSDVSEQSTTQNRNTPAQEERDDMKTINTEDLVLEYYATRDMGLRDTIVVQLSGLVESVARRFVGSGEPFEDLVQEGYLGLLNALDLFDPKKEVKFTTYATHLVIGQIKHYLRDKGKIIKEPAWLQELNHKINRVMHELTIKHGRPPSMREIADFMEMTTRAVEDVLTTREIFKVSSLDAVMEDEEGEWSGYDLEKLPCELEQTFNLPIEERMVLERAMLQLKELDQKVLQYFFYEGYNQTEIAHMLSISCNYVSHILRNATQKLRRILTEEEWKDQQKQAQIAHQRGEIEAHILDPHTGLYSRAYADVRLEEEIQRASRYGNMVGVVLVDIVHLEDLQRSFGEFTLSELLVQSAGETRQVLRKADIVARFDAYQLSALLPYAGEHTPQIALRIETHLRNWISELFSESRLQPEIHIGWATYPQEAKNSEEMISIAQNRLQESRRDSEELKAA
jgi:RNA polymerase sigma-B factor